MSDIYNAPNLTTRQELAVLFAEAIYRGALAGNPENVKDGTPETVAEYALRTADAILKEEE